MVRQRGEEPPPRIGRVRRRARRLRRRRRPGPLHRLGVEARRAHGRPPGGSNALYRNDGRRHVRRTSPRRPASGDDGWGCGVAAGDYDNDGDLDLYVTNYGPNVLYRNRGDGTFEDVTTKAGVGRPAAGRRAPPSSTPTATATSTSTSRTTSTATWRRSSPPERDSRVEGRRCSSARSACRASADRFYRNRGDGTFEDATAAAGHRRDTGRFFGYTAWSPRTRRRRRRGPLRRERQQPELPLPEQRRRDVHGGRHVERRRPRPANGDAQAGMGVDAGRRRRRRLDMDLIVANFAEDYGDALPQPGRRALHRRHRPVRPRPPHLQRPELGRGPLRLRPRRGPRLDRRQRPHLPAGRRTQGTVRRLRVPRAKPALSEQREGEVPGGHARGGAGLWGRGALARSRRRGHRRRRRPRPRLRQRGHDADDPPERRRERPPVAHRGPPPAARPQPPHEREGHRDGGRPHARSARSAPATATPRT